MFARTQARVHWFSDPLKDDIVRIISDAVEASDVELHAFVIMNNHFHLLARQGAAPLWRFMHPIVRRTALAAKREWGLEDHVFGARYQHRQCCDGADLRGCIRYIHRNPIQAGCCRNPADYPWSSHVAYQRVLESEQWRPRLNVLRGLFASGSARSPNELCADYTEFVTTDIGDDTLRNRFRLPVGDAFGRELFERRRHVASLAPRKRRDLRDVVRDGMRDLCPTLDLEMVRTFHGALMRGIRNELARRCAREGYQGCQIARYLNMSESQVSKVVRRAWQDGTAFKKHGKTGQTERTDKLVR